MINIRITELQNPEDLKIPTEPYMVRGRVKISYINETWTSEVIEFKKVIKDEVQPVFLSCHEKIYELALIRIKF